MKLLHNKGFTLVELLIAAMVLVVAICGILATYVTCFETVVTSQNLRTAIDVAQSKIDQIRNAPFGVICTFNIGPNNVFTANVGGVTYVGRIYVDNCPNDPVTVTVSVCWRQKGGRVIGEDRNLNGALNAGEDGDGNNRIDSPAQIVTVVTARG